MGKQGPCRHCGVTSTPLWRNGPPEKPVLCNACGSRWRTKGSLTNYTPLHAREPLDSEEFKVSKPKTIYLKPKEQKSHAKKYNNETMEIEHEMPYSGQNFRKILEGDTSNRSSSGSVISYAESCAYFGTTDASDLTGSAQSNVWDSLVPSKKRSGVARLKPSPVEKLTKDLYSIMHEQSSYLTVSSEEDLLYDCGTPMGSFEIGHGGILIRCPNSKTVEEESEASSLPVDNKSYIINEGYSGSASFVVHSESKGIHSNAGSKKLKVSTAQLTQQHVKRDKIFDEKLDILRDRGSSLSSIDLKDIATFEVFMKHTTHEDQQRLMRFLPSMDTGKPPESLRDMFQSPQFMETFSSFQKLLVEGVFDLSFSETNVEESRTLKRLVLLNSTKSKWVEHYKKIKDAQITRGKYIASGTNCFGSSYLAPLKRPRDHQNQHYQELKGVMRSPKRVPKPGDINLPAAKQLQLNSTDAGSKLIHDPDDFIDNEGACFSPRSIFASPPDRSSMLVSLQFTGESSDQDLLLDMPCNASFPEAELLFHPWNSRKTAQDSSPAVSGVAAGEESLSNNLSYSFSSQNQRHR